jgi:hypothetical protein
MIYFVGIVKDIAPSIPILKLFSNLIFKKFPDAKFILYENNSRDGTADLLKEWAATNDAIRVISEMIDPCTQLDSCKARTWDNKPCRMELIAAARNRLMELLWEASPAPNDLVVIMDFDISKIPTMQTLFKYLEHFPEDADAIFANGVSAKSNAYYDLYALRTLANPVGPEIIGEQFWKKMSYITFPQTDTTLIPVISAFGGIGIYRAGAIKGAKYSGVVTPNLDKLYKTLFSIQPALKTAYEQTAMRVRDGVLHAIKLYGDILYQNNSGYNFPVVCEHSTFHADMAAAGYTRLFIASDLVYTSTH